MNSCEIVCDLRDASATPAEGCPKGCRANAAALRYRTGLCGSGYTRQAILVLS
ncbi:hypothetical protein [Allocoleopsis sp.]|uniref:hypothetical protein n=1 Tax=Allocoleopsis sp. TaxID=3088169 RepID=UPI002FD141BB